MGWQLKAGVALAIAALIGYLVWREHSLTRKLAEVRVELSQANANYTALRTAYDHERKIAKEASDGYQADLARLSAERDKPLSVRLCKRTAANVPATAAAASGSDAASPPDDSGETSPDIGPALLDYGIACEANQLQLERLQEWILAR